MDEQTHIRIDQYLQGELSPADRADFEQAMAQNPELAAEVALQRDIEAALSEPEVADLEQKLAQIVAQESSARVIALKGWQRWAAAASVVLILGLGYLLLRGLQKPRTAEELYLAYAELPKDLQGQSAVRSGPTENDSGSVASIWLEVDSLYQAGAYISAEAKLKAWSTQHPAPPANQAMTYHYYLGMLKLQQGDFEVAFAELKQVQTGPYAENAHWYRTLVQLRLEGITEEVRAELQVFSGYENPYRGVAKELLELDR